MKKMHTLALSIARAKLKGTPYKLNYAVTYRCNSRCRICNTWKRYVISPEKQKEELSLPEIDSIFREVDLSWLSLTGGEPFLREDLAAIALTAEKHNPHLQMLSIPTNGSLPDTVFKTAELLLEEMKIPNFLITISLDGGEELHDQLRGVKGLWKKARETYYLLKSIEDDRFEVFLEFTISKFNAGHLKNALDSFGVADYSHVVVTAAHSSYFYASEQTDLHEASSLLQAHEYLSLQNFSTPESVIPYIYGRLLEKRFKKIPFSLQCVSGRSSFFLDPYGFLYPCISWDEPLGKVKETSLRELLRGKKTRSLIEKIKKGDCPRCWTPCEAYQTILENFPLALAAALLK